MASTAMSFILDFFFSSFAASLAKRRIDCAFTLFNGARDRRNKDENILAILLEKKDAKGAAKVAPFFEGKDSRFLSRQFMFKYPNKGP